ncbi:formate dehydrogenase accessory sulfurtransferase FdhD [Actibacterium sp.]|uniref:formate dehydrogenase accessory sulfurtransferase FdhD n=1 Tax=Actibacterium sp. TaxID=1872125 RepID=UPI00356645AE
MKGAVDIGLPNGGQHTVADEVAVALSYNGSTQAVMLATPADLLDFAAGFSLTEGIVTDLAQIDRMELAEHPNGLEVQLWLTDPAEARLAERRRFMAGPVGCGLCGIDSLEQALRPLPALPADQTRLTETQITAAIPALRAAQPLHDLTHAVHAAGFLHTGALDPVREDVGRHNALDKVIGVLARSGRDAAGGALVITSRVSVEMVQKAVLARAPVLIAASAPTARAVALAEAAGLTLVALARETGFQIFTHPQRIDTKGASDVA